MVSVWDCCDQSAGAVTTDRAGRQADSTTAVAVWDCCDQSAGAVTTDRAGRQTDSTTAVAVIIAYGSAFGTYPVVNHRLGTVGCSRGPGLKFQTCERKS